MICINDDDSVSNEAFQELKQSINKELEMILPDPCGFENV